MKNTNPLPQVIFLSRWLQLPLYLGLIFVQALYAYRFILEVYELMLHGTGLPEAQVMMAVLGLIDVVMISNLLIMVIVGGYQTFVSKLQLDDHPDRPEWLDRANTSTLKIKLALSLITISSIHLLETFINVDQQTDHSVMWQVIIHLAFLLSAASMAWIDHISHLSRSPATMRRRSDT